MDCLVKARRLSTIPGRCGRRFRQVHAVNESGRHGACRGEAEFCVHMCLRSYLRATASLRGAAARKTGALAAGTEIFSPVLMFLAVLAALWRPAKEPKPMSFTKTPPECPRFQPGDEWPSDPQL